MNIKQRRAMALQLLLQPIVLTDAMSIEEKKALIAKRRGEVSLVYPFMTLDERHAADEWVRSAPRTSDPDLNPDLDQGPAEIKTRDRHDSYGFDYVDRSERSPSSHSRRS
jgi:hypothetical protein